MRFEGIHFPTLKFFSARFRNARVSKAVVYDRRRTSSPLHRDGVLCFSHGWAGYAFEIDC